MSCWPKVIFLHLVVIIQQQQPTRRQNYFKRNKIRHFLYFYSYSHFLCLHLQPTRPGANVVGGNLSIVKACLKSALWLSVVRYVTNFRKSVRVLYISLLYIDIPYFFSFLSSYQCRFNAAESKWLDSNSRSLVSKETALPNGATTTAPWTLDYLLIQPNKFWLNFNDIFLHFLHATIE